MLGWFYSITILVGLFDSKVVFLRMGFARNYSYLIIMICKQLQLQVTILNTNNLHTVIWFQVFLFNTDNLYRVIWFQVFLFNTHNLYAVIWFQVFLFNTDNLYLVIWFQVFLFNTHNLCAIIWFQVNNKIHNHFKQVNSSYFMAIT